jgi:glutaredoxin-like YruB-family protein
MAKVKIYTTPTCVYCMLTKEFFKQNNIEYEEVNVAFDQAGAKEMIAKSGQMGVPVISIEKDGKEKIVVGFNKEKLSELLEIKG